MDPERTIRVRTPAGVVWRMRFRTRTAAWNRIANTRRVAPSLAARRAFAAEGWRVWDEAEANAPATA